MVETIRSGKGRGRRVADNKGRGLLQGIKSKNFGEKRKSSFVGVFFTLERIVLEITDNGLRFIGIAFTGTTMSVDQEMRGELGHN